ncbi:MAG: FAD-binding oxidoreductase [Candidatus Nanopelagicales bacterium]
MDPHPYRGLSLWHDQQLDAGDDLMPRAPLAGDRDADVAIVGAGYTGLWTALSLLDADPSVRVVVVERDIAGFGASGRNGGWASAIFPTPWQRIAKESSADDARRMQLALCDAVDGIGRVASAEGIDCDYVKGGYLAAARNLGQLQRARQEVEHARAWGFGEDFIQLLDAKEFGELVSMSKVAGGTFTPHCAAIHPAKLVRGLALAVERRGGVIYEQTEVDAIEPGVLRTRHGDVRAEFIVRATEGYTAELPGMRRDIVPMYSLMVATEPLTDAVWKDLGLAGRATFGDKRHLRIYGQRTADGRIAFGGRGAPYHFGSRVESDFDSNDRVHAMLRAIVIDLFPSLKDVTFTHAWGGALGIPRDWFPRVGLDRGTGLAWAGGYVGDGVTTSFLAGRTLADLITGTNSDLVDLPWVGRRSRKWEPEPLRWTGVNAVTALMATGDRTEARTGQPSKSVAAFWRTMGF